MLKIKKADNVKDEEEKKKFPFLLEDYDHVHKDMLLLYIDEVMVEDGQRDISLDHVPQLSILENDH